MKKTLSKSRIYICHTFYHVYVSMLKELALPETEHGKATLVLSKMSNNFGSMYDKALECELFEAVYEYDEKRPDFFPELDRYRKNKGNIVVNSFSRIIFTKKFAKLQANFVPVDFKEYKDIYVYCDNDPIGIYLSQNRIYYHAMEDGLNYLKAFVPAIHDNKAAFKFKVFLSDKLNLIFIRDGFNKYCIDMEVNDISVISYPCKKYKEIPRQPLIDRLTSSDKETILKVFVDDFEKMNQKIGEATKAQNGTLILTEPLCDLETRKKLFSDLINEYSQYGPVFIKPHPRDILDYPTEFMGIPQFAASIPMEMLNFFPQLKFKRVVSVFTPTDSIAFAEEKIKLGTKFMDKYEDASMHNKIME